MKGDCLLKSIWVVFVILQLEGFAQRPLTKPERKFLDVIYADTSSQNVCYLPRSYWFGIEDRSEGGLIFIKNGRKNIFLRDGTHHVFLLTKNRNEYRLKRLDSSRHSGDNFRMMAFQRKDTFYIYGGYGFWTTRDFFMRFREKAGDWEFVTGGKGLPNEKVFNYFDFKGDQFYVLGSLSTTHHPKAQKIFRDSVYRYHFLHKSWENLGAIHKNFYEYRNLIDKTTFTSTPFGIVYGQLSSLCLLDIVGNQYYRLSEQSSDLFYQIDKTHKPYYQNDYNAIIYLGDSLHVFNGDSNNAVHSAVKLHKNNFDTRFGGEIYVPLENPAKKYARYVIISLVPIIAILATRSYVRKHSSKSKKLPTRQDMNPPLPVSVIEGANDLSFFLDAMIGGDKSVLEALVLSSRQGYMMYAEDINKILGVANRDPIMQKSRRSHSISRINQTYMQVMKTQESLVLRHRDELDKRSFVYGVNEKLLKDFDGYI